MCGSTEITIEEFGDRVRGEIKKSADLVRAIKGHSHFRGEQRYPCEHYEMKANLDLAYRHLEDARMRIGKVLQAYQGGVSILDRAKDDLKKYNRESKES